jgi:uncharacterized protein HemY
VVLNSLSQSLYAVGAYGEAEDLCQQGLAFCRERCQIYTYSWLYRLGLLAFKIGDYDRAERQLHESLEIAFEVEDRFWVALNYDLLGRLDLKMD